MIISTSLAARCPTRLLCSLFDNLRKSDILPMLGRLRASSSVRMNSKIKSKIRAFLASLAVTLTFFFILSPITYFYWYPKFLFWSDGGLQGLELVFAIDLVLGPVLVFVAFNPTKTQRHQRLDVAVLFLIQFAAMAWGAWQIYTERPVALTFHNKKFSTLPISVLAKQNKTTDDLKQFGKIPVYLTSQKDPRPTDAYHIVVDDISWEHQYDHFLKIDNDWPRTKEEAKQNLQIKPKAVQEEIGNFVKALNCESCAAFIVEARYTSVVIVLDDQQKLHASMPLFKD